MTIFDLRNGNGMTVAVMELGATIVRVEVPDRSGDIADVVLGFDSPDEYGRDRNYFGAVVGRYANRIAHGRFALDDRRHELAINNAPNHLHGGARGFDACRWSGMRVPNGIEFSLTSPNGDEGYPGTLSACVTYFLDEDNRLSVQYAATTDAPTVVNLTQHSYFNLAGHDAGDVLDHELTITADFFTPVDATLIPTGEVAPVHATPFDFRAPKTIGRDIDAHDVQLEFGAGYDHNFVLTEPLGRDGLRDAATLFDPISGRQMTVRTDQPGLQFYSGNVLDGSARGKAGACYARRSGLCLETQRFPNSPNVAHFPSCVLRPGATFRSCTTFTFGVRR